MPAPPLANTIEGTPGASLNTDLAAGSGNAFQSTTIGLNSTLNYSTTQKHSGSTSAELVEPATSVITNAIWSGMAVAGGVDVWFRLYVRLPSIPPATLRIMSMFTAAAVQSARLNINLTTGFLAAVTGGGSAINTGSVAIATNQDVRIEMRLRSSTTVGQVEWWLFNSAESTVADDHLNATGLVLGADTDSVRIGVTQAGPASYTFNWDDPAVSLDGLIGPTAGLDRPLRRFPLGV